MNKVLRLILVLLSAVFCFFNPASMTVDISAFTLINFTSLVVLLIAFALKQEQIREIKLSKTETGFAVVLGLCLTLSCGLVHGDEFDVFYSSAGTIIFSLAEWVFFSFVSMTLFKLFFCKYEEFFGAENISARCGHKGIFGFVIKKIDDNKFGFYFLSLVIMWLLPFIINFPGLIMFDTRYQFCMYNHIPNKYTFASVLIDEGQYITQHHSVPHTLMVGFILNLGKNVFGSYDAGIFIYCVIQYFVITVIGAYMLKCIKPTIGTKYTFITLAFIALHPFFPVSAVLVTKDIYFCGFFVLFILDYYKIIKSPEIIKKKSFFVRLVIISVLLMLFRNNALYTLIIISVGLFFFTKKRVAVALYMVILLVFNSVYANMLLPSFSISKGSVREMLSIPLQQTARYVYKYPEEVTKEEHKDISGVLLMNGIINRYTPDLSDPVKDGFNKESTGEDLKKYFKVWGSMFVKHPVTYAEAFLLLNYGYYCPGVKDSVTYDCINDTDARTALSLQDNVDIKAEDPGIVSMGYYWFQCFTYLSPVINLMMDSGVYIWLWILLMFVLLRNKADKKYLMYYLPYFAYLLCILAGPVNGTIYSRYIMPFVYTLPLMFLPVFECKNREEIIQ